MSTKLVSLLGTQLELTFEVTKYRWESEQTLKLWCEKDGKIVTITKGMFAIVIQEDPPDENELLIQRREDDEQRSLDRLR